MDGEVPQPGEAFLIKLAIAAIVTWAPRVYSSLFVGNGIENLEGDDYFDITDDDYTTEKNIPTTTVTNTVTLTAAPSMVTSDSTSSSSSWASLLKFCSMVMEGHGLPAMLTVLSITLAFLAGLMMFKPSQGKKFSKQGLTAQVGDRRAWAASAAGPTLLTIRKADAESLLAEWTTKIDSLQSKVEKLGVQSAEFNENKKVLSDQLVMSRLEVTALKRENRCLIEAQQAEVQALCEEGRKLEKDNELKDGQLGAKEEKLTALGNDKKKLREDMSSLVKKHKDEIQGLGKKLEAAKAKIAEQKQHLIDAKHPKFLKNIEENVKLHGRNEELTIAIRRLEQQLKQQAGQEKKVQPVAEEKRPILLGAGDSHDAPVPDSTTAA